jgi:hypothetical protein
MKTTVRLALVGIVFAAACGSDSTAPTTRRLNLFAVDGHAIPATVYSVAGDQGSVVGGYVDVSAIAGQNGCGFRLSLHREGTSGSGTSDSVGSATCSIDSQGNATATINLGASPPWGSHVYTFKP